MKIAQYEADGFRAVDNNNSFKTKSFLYESKRGGVVLASIYQNFTYCSRAVIPQHYGRNGFFLSQLHSPGV